jgi:drug/metabolite transporter (DMT)-like permease
MANSVRPLDRVAVLVVLLLCASWGFNQITAKYALTEIPPLTQAAMRSGFAALVVGAFALWRPPRLIASDGTLAGGLLCGLLFGIEFIVLFVGLQWTTASHAILFLYSAPFFVSLGLLFIAPDERLSRLQWFGLFLSFCGVAVALGVASVSRLQLIGDALSLLAGALWAGTTLVVKGSRLKLARPEKVLLYQLVVSTFVIGAAAIIAGERLPTHVSPLVAFCFAYQTFWIVSVTFFLWFWLIARYRAGELSAFTFLTPVFGVLASVILMGDPVTPAFLGAVALVAGGILLVNWPAVRNA